MGGGVGANLDLAGKVRRVRQISRLPLLGLGLDAQREANPPATRSAMRPCRGSGSELLKASLPRTLPLCGSI
jgi:hypothetical protein